MFKPFSAVKFLTLFSLIIGSVLSAHASRATADDPNWTFHASFDNNPRKIIDTSDKVYFFVHQIIYHKNYDGGQLANWYNTPSGALLILDKNNKEAGLQNLQSMTNLSGGDMRLFNVDPATGTMVIAYLDGGIDIVTPDYKVTYIDIVKRRTFPGASTIHNISFDPETHNIWLGTGDGFVCISGNTKQILYNAQWNSTVYDICPVGSEVIAIIDGVLHAAEADSDLRRKDSFKSIATASSGISGTPQRLMPLDASNFVYATSSGIYARAYMQANGTWKGARLVSDSGTLQADAISVSDRLEQTWIPTAKGIYFASASKGYFVNRPEAEGAAPVLKTISLPSGSTLYSASYNQEDFWFYRDRSELICRTLEGTSWTDPQVYTNNGPLMCKDVHFLYSPEYGFITMNAEPGIKNGAGGHGCIRPPLITSYRNGKWTNLSTIHNRPYYADENASFANAWKAYSVFYPVGDPQGAAIDPLFPQYVHVGSLWCGISSIHIDDPREYPIISCVPNYAFGAFPSQKDLPQQTWGTITSASVSGFDADNVLWVAHNNSWNRGHEGDISVRYWTPEARRAALESGDPANAGNWVELSIPTLYWAETWNISKALAHKRNKGKILISASGFVGGTEGGRPLMVFDHKGTLEDTSDDSIEFITRVLLDNGAKMSFGTIYRIDENPITGDVYLFTQYETYILDINQPIENYCIKGRNVSFSSDFGPGCEFLNPMQIYSSCFDEYGRVWIGGKGTGVVGLSADGKDLIAHFTSETTPLLSDNIHGLGWNPETKSLFISTDIGMQEVKVEGILRTSPATGIQAPFLTPDVIRPNYAGSVTVNNIPLGATLKAVNAEGKTVAALPAPQHGVSYWDLLDSNGMRVPTGRYTIVDATATTDFPALHVVVTR